MDAKHAGIRIIPRDLLTQEELSTAAFIGSNLNAAAGAVTGAIADLTTALQDARMIPHTTSTYTTETDHALASELGTLTRAVRAIETARIKLEERMRESTEAHENEREAIKAHNGEAATT